MNGDEYFQSEYFKAEDLDGKPLPVVIDKVEVHELGRDKKSKLVVIFEGEDKKLPLNKINYKYIRKNYGKETTDWHDKPIVLIPEETSFGSDTVDCIRLRIPKKGEASFNDNIPS